MLPAMTTQVFDGKGECRALRGVVAAILPTPVHNAIGIAKATHRAGSPTTGGCFVTIK